MLPITRAHHVHVPHSLAILAGVALLATALIWDHADNGLDNGNAVDAVSATPLQVSTGHGETEPVTAPVRVPVDRTRPSVRGGECANCNGDSPLSPLLLLDLLPH